MHYNAFKKPHSSRSDAHKMHIACNNPTVHSHALSTRHCIMTCTLCAFHVDAMAVPPAKRSFAEAVISTSDAIDAMGKLVDDTNGQYTDIDMKKDVKLVLRELHSFRKGVPPDRGEAREGTKTATAKSYHKIVTGQQKYDMDNPLGGWETARRLAPLAPHCSRRAARGRLLCLASALGTAARCPTTSRPARRTAR